MSQLLRNILNGSPHPDAPLRVARFLEWLRDLLRRRLGIVARIDRSDGDDRLPDAGKLAPLVPSPTHHLVAAKRLPPWNSEITLPFD